MCGGTPTRSFHLFTPEPNLATSIWCIKPKNREGYNLENLIMIIKELRRKNEKNNFNYWRHHL